MNVRLVLTHVIQILEPIVPTLLVATTVPASQDFMEMDLTVLVRNVPSINRQYIHYRKGTACAIEF